MWSKAISVGCIMMTAAWAIAFGLIGLGWTLDELYVSHLGMAAAVLGGTLTLMREHQRTRRTMYSIEKRRESEPPRATGGGGGNVSEFVRRDDH